MFVVFEFWWLYGWGSQEYEKTGLGAADFVGRGADAVTYSEAARGTADFVARGGDATTYVETGRAVIDAFISSGPGDEEQASTGLGIADFVARGADATTYVEAGRGISEFAAAATDVSSFNRTGSGALDLVARGADTVTYAEAGRGIVDLVARATDAATANRTGSGVSEFSARGADTVTWVEAGRGVQDLVASGSVTKTVAKHGAGVIDFSGDGIGYTSIKVRPVSDVATGTWTVAPLWEKIDETLPDDGDYISSGISPPAAFLVLESDGTSQLVLESGAGSLLLESSAPDICEVKLGAAADPGRDDFHEVAYRIGTSVPTGSAIDLTVRLVQGTTVIASWTHTAPAAYTTYEQTLSEAQAANITDYTDLRLRFEAVAV